MELKKVVSSLLPTFKKNRLFEDLKITKGELAELQSVYSTGAITFRSWSFKSQEVKDLVAVFKRNIGGQNSDNPIVHIEKNLKHVIAAAEKLEGLIERYLNEDVSGLGLSYKQANVIQFFDALGLVNKYARKLLFYVYVHETAQFKTNTLEVRESITPADEAWVKDKLLDFCIAYGAIIKAEPGMEDTIDSIPEIAVSGSEGNFTASSQSGRKVEPFGFSGMSGFWNPILTVRLFIAEWQHTRYREAEAELEVIKLRLLNLKKQAEGKNDAALEKQIAIMESKMQRKAAELAAMES